MTQAEQHLAIEAARDRLNQGMSALDQLSRDLVTAPGLNPAEKAAIRMAMGAALAIRLCALYTEGTPDVVMAKVDQVMELLIPEEESDGDE